jgi:hypothetical protein
LRNQLAAIDRLRHDALVGPAELSIDGLYQEVWLRLALADTSSAIAALDASLGALPGQSALFFEYVQRPAALVYAMALRARLAARRGDWPTARRWAGAVTELWADSDPGLAIDLPGLRSLAVNGKDAGRGTSR